MKTDEEMKIGAQAESLLNDPIIRGALDKMKEEVVNQWAACPARDVEGREWLWRHYQLALKFEENLQSVINTGKLATKRHWEDTVVDKAKRFFKAG